MSKLRCAECGCTIHGTFVPILGEIKCIDCAEQWMEDELAEIKKNNRAEYLERMAETLTYQILEV